MSAGLSAKFPQIIFTAIALGLFLAFLFTPQVFFPIGERYDTFWTNYLREDFLHKLLLTVTGIVPFALAIEVWLIKRPFKIWVKILFFLQGGGSFFCIFLNMMAVTFYMTKCCQDILPTYKLAIAFQVPLAVWSLLLAIPKLGDWKGFAWPFAKHPEEEEGN